MTERILIADASEDARRHLRAALESALLTVSEASDTREAMQLLRAERHHVALIDRKLPGGALELVDALKTDPDLTGTAVVLLSADVGMDALLGAVERGVTDCLKKPIEPVEAVVRVRAALRVAHLQHAVREGNERLTELAATDDLTGLLARRFVESHLRGLVSAARRHGRPLSVAMIDLDNFKEINDRYGHPVGDFVLRTAANRMRSRLRQEDLLGRWGGDELMLVLPDIDLDGALAATDALRTRVAETAVAVDGERIPITISAGAAAWQDENVYELIERADAALYAAKARGRNRVRAAHVPRAA